nr:DUF4112 domain-containing protein [Ruegeria atlantica]
MNVNRTSAQVLYSHPSVFAGYGLNSDLVTKYERLAHLLDTRFQIPVLNLPVGLDAIFGVVPGLGTFVTLAPGLAMMWEVVRMGGRRRTLARMAGYTLADTIIGSVPIVGDIGDMYFRSHVRNARLLREEYQHAKSVYDKGILMEA